MRGIRNTEHPNPRLEGRRIRVSDILYTLLDDDPNEQFKFWDLEQYKVFSAIQFYWQNKSEFVEWQDKEGYETPSLEEIDDAIRAWDGFGDTVVEFEDAVGTGTQFCPDCEGRLETDWDDYSLECQVCGEKYRSEEITVLWRAKNY